MLCERCSKGNELPRDDIHLQITVYVSNAFIQYLRVSLPSPDHEHAEIVDCLFVNNVEMD
jgi:hypothetical protein